MPGLVQADRTFRNQRVQFISLSPQAADELDAVKAFINEFDAEWPVGYGAEATLKGLGLQYIPTMFVVGRDGRIAWNSETGGELSDAITAALSAE